MKQHDLRFLVATASKRHHAQIRRRSDHNASADANARHRRKSLEHCTGSDLSLLSLKTLAARLRHQRRQLSGERQQEGLLLVVESTSPALLHDKHANHAPLMHQRHAHEGSQFHLVQSRDFQKCRMNSGILQIDQFFALGDAPHQSFAKADADAGAPLVEALIGLQCQLLLIGLHNIDRAHFHIQRLGHAPHDDLQAAVQIIGAAHRLNDSLQRFQHRSARLWHNSTCAKAQQPQPLTIDRHFKVDDLGDGPPIRGPAPVFELRFAMRVQTYRLVFGQHLQQKPYLRLPPESLAQSRMLGTQLLRHLVMQPSRTASGYAHGLLLQSDLLAQLPEHRHLRIFIRVDTPLRKLPAPAIDALGQQSPTATVNHDHSHVRAIALAYFREWPRVEI